MGLKYWRFGAVALSALLILFTGGADLALGADPQADDVVFDAVVSVHWVDSDHGPMEGATVRIFFYHDGDPIPGIVPLGDPIDADGNAVITDAPRPAEGSTPLLLDVFGDLTTSTIDEQGCTRIESWSAQQKGVTADLAVDVVLLTSAQSVSVNCPDATPTPSATATDPGAPTPTTPPTPASSVLGATGQPPITPPATDATGGTAAPTESPFVAVFLALVALAVVFLPASSRTYARRYSRRN